MAGVAPSARADGDRGERQRSGLGEADRGGARVVRRRARDDAGDGGRHPEHRQILDHQRVAAPYGGEGGGQGRRHAVAPMVPCCAQTRSDGHAGHSRSEDRDAGSAVAARFDRRAAARALRSRRGRGAVRRVVARAPSARERARPRDVRASARLCAARRRRRPAQCGRRVSERFQRRQVRADHVRTAGARGMTTAADKSRKVRNATQRERRRLDRLHAFEERARASGYRLVGGIDEVGRGPLAGPVVAACVVTDGPLRLRGLNDSKQVTPELREVLAVEIKSVCVAWAIGEATVEEIDRLNIYWASILAMERALAALHVAPEYLLTDAVRIKTWAGMQEPVIKGDAQCATVAAASIVAKVHRDGLLVALHDRYPQYGFAQHKGYASPQHIAALNAHGPCAEHRRAFWRVRAAWDALPGMAEFVADPDQVVPS